MDNVDNVNISLEKKNERKKKKMKKENRKKETPNLKGKYKTECKAGTTAKGRFISGQYFD